MSKNQTKIIDFNYLSSFVVDNESNSLEKIINPLSRDDLKNVKNIFGQTLIFCAVATDRLKIAEYLVKKGLTWNDIDNNGTTLFHWAVKFSSFTCIKSMLNSGNVKEKIFSKDQNGVTPLHLAAKNKRGKILKILIDAAKQFTNDFSDVRDRYNRSPLHYAAHSGSLESCAVLLEDDLFIVDLRDNMKQIPLMYAIGCKYACDVVKLLGKKKPMSITARDNLGLTPFHLAVIANNSEALNILLTEFFDVHPTIFDNFGRTPLHYAAAFGRVEIAEMLIQFGFTNTSVDKFGATPAHYAAKKCVDTLQVILSAGNTVDIEDKNKRTCLMWAVLAENEPVVLWMLSNQSLNIDRRAKDEYLCTALHLASHVGSLKIAKILIKQGWSLTDKDINDATPSHIAAAGGHTELIRYFQTALANNDDKDDAGRTPLFYACAGGQASTVKIMINDLNFDAKVYDDNEQTPFHYAAMSGISACVKTLIDKEAEMVNIADNNGRTPLHIACLKGKRDVVKTLINAGANINAETIHGDTPLSIATSLEHQQIISLLNLYGAKAQ